MKLKGSFNKYYKQAKIQKIYFNIFKANRTIQT